jgi:hypothetical protein
VPDKNSSTWSPYLEETRFGSLQNPSNLVLSASVAARYSVSGIAAGGVIRWATRRAKSAAGEIEIEVGIVS